MGQQMAKIKVNDLKVTTVWAKTDSVKGHKSHGPSKTKQNKQTNNVVMLFESRDSWGWHR